MTPRKEENDERQKENDRMNCAHVSNIELVGGAGCFFESRGKSSR